MLIYNSKKEFVGIDEQELKIFGFSTISELRAESANFADMFVRIPGYIHNFKYVHWIDYIVYGGTNNPKAIINARGKNYQCNIAISTIYLTDYPASQAYIINLQNLRELTQKEVDAISEDLANKPKPATVNQINPPKKDYAKEEAIRASIAKENSLINNNGDLDTNITTVQTTTKVSTPKVDVKQEVVKQPEAKEEEKVLKEEKPSNKTTTDENLNYDPNYVFDPQVASDELGLPIDLIEEFIEDFIAQAQEFKDELYKYLAEEDINNVRILSHKLKGVAANLRVEDAFEVLATINTATDLKVIKENLNIFYKIIAKLSGEEIDIEHIEVTSQEEDDLLVLEFKDDNDIITPPKEKVTVDNELNLEIVPSLTDLPISYNKEDVAKEMGIDTDTFNQLFEDYLTDAMQICNSIKEAISKNDSKRWNQETIQLKGMSENMRVELFINELEVLLKTSRQDEASGAIEHIISIISTMKV